MATIDAREFFKRWPTFYYAVATVLGPLWWSGLSANAYLKTVDGENKILNIGSGPRILNDKRVVNVDITPYPGVEIVAQAEKIPLADGSVGGVVLDNVLEHVEYPGAAIAEIKRLLVPGGTVYIATPFLYPFHSSPHDYSRWTVGGLKSLLGDDFEILQSGVRCGPFSALTSFFSHFFAMIFSFGHAGLRALLFNVFMIPLIPVKLLDIIFAHFPGAEELAAVLYVVAKKK